MATLFKTKYKDDEVVRIAEEATDADPMIDGRRLKISSKNGVITLEGTLPNSSTRAHLHEVITSALARASLKFDHIEDRTVI
jgi:osmotically-inducible protein OsmY